MNIKMNGVRAVVLGMFAVAMSGAVVIAQDTTAAPPPAGHRDPAQMEARQLQMMTERLKLTPDQATQVKAIEDNQRTQMMLLRQDSTVPREDKHGKMLALRQENEGKIREVLTDEQKPKYDAMLARQREHVGHRPDGAGGPPPAAPPQ